MIDVDVNGDGLIDGTDIAAIGGKYNNVSTDANFVSAYDINKDNQINVIDLARIGFEWGTR